MLFYVQAHRVFVSECVSSMSWGMCASVRVFVCVGQWGKQGESLRHLSPSPITTCTIPGRTLGQRIGCKCHTQKNATTQKKSKKKLRARKFASAWKYTLKKNPPHAALQILGYNFLGGRGGIIADELPPCDKMDFLNSALFFLRKGWKIGCWGDQFSF